MEQLDLTYTVPLTQDQEGTIRIRGSRVTLGSILHSFQQGATAEQIHDSFPSVALRDIYGAIAYYLEHREQIDEYLKAQAQSARDLRRSFENRLDVVAFRDRIRVRRLQRERT